MTTERLKRLLSSKMSPREQRWKVDADAKRVPAGG